MSHSTPLEAVKKLREIAEYLARFSDNGQHRRIPGPDAGHCHVISKDILVIADALSAESESTRIRELERDLAEAKRLGHLAADNCDEALECAKEAVRQRDEALQSAGRTILPDCMTGPSEPCDGYKAISSELAAARRQIAVMLRLEEDQAAEIARSYTQSATLRIEPTPRMIEAGEFARQHWDEKVNSVPLSLFIYRAMMTVASHG